MQLDAIYEVDENGDTQDDKFQLNSVSSNKPAIFKHKEIVDIIQARKDIENAQEEWDNLGPITLNDENIQDQSLKITCSQVLDYFREKNMTQYLKNIKPLKSRSGLEAFKHWFAGPPKLNISLISERNLFFAIALCPFDTSDEIHMRVLQTIYKTLSGDERDCPRYGKHWEELGFQGIDPGTDLRGVGFLGLIHLLSFSLSSSTCKLSKEILALSKTENQNFPFCTMGINITRIVVEAMREEVLNRECNRQMKIFDVTNDFYAAIFLRLFKIWQEQNKTIMDSGFVIKDLNIYAKRHTNVILKELFTHVKLLNIPVVSSDVI